MSRFGDAIDSERGQKSSGPSLESHWPWCPRSSAPEVIAHNQAENEPSGTHRALQGTAYLGFSDTRVVAYGNFDDAKSGQCAFEDHLNCPAIGGLLQSERAQYIGAGSAKGAEIADVYFVEKPDQASGETIPKHLMPRHCPSRVLLVQAGTERDVRAPLRDWRQKNWQFGRPVAVVAIQEDNHVGGICRRETCEAGSPVASARLLNDAGSHFCSDVGRAVG